MDLYDFVREGKGELYLHITDWEDGWPAGHAQQGPGAGVGQGSDGEREGNGEGWKDTPSRDMGQGSTVRGGDGSAEAHL